MKKTQNIATGMFLAATLAMSMSLAAPAHAGSEGRKNTTLVLGAVALHQLLTGKTTNGLIAGAGTAVAYKNYKDAKKDEDRAERHRRYERVVSKRVHERRWKSGRR
jgi:uncharacterized membrane protein YebE (DUF533 family)